MAAATKERLKNLVGQYAAEEAAFDEALSLASETVQGAGVAVEHSAFARLHMYFAAHLIEVSGGDTGKRSSRSASDVSTAYQSSMDSRSSWLGLYESALLNVVGMNGRIA